MFEQDTIQYSYDMRNMLTGRLSYPEKIDTL